MNKQIRFIQVLTLAMAMLTIIPTLAIAEITFDVAGRASIIDEGVGAFVTVGVTCDSVFGNNNTLTINTLSLTQRSGDSVAWGVYRPAQTVINCDGITPKTFKFLITTKLKIFSSGQARIQIAAQLFGSSGFDSGEFTKDIQLDLQGQP